MIFQIIVSTLCATWLTIGIFFGILILATTQVYNLKVGWIVALTCPFIWPIYLIYWLFFYIGPDE